jgi:hypothetical protein
MSLDRESPEAIPPLAPMAAQPRLTEGLDELADSLHLE